MIEKIKIGIASDHAGYERKLEIINFIKRSGYFFTDFGAFTKESSDYPDFIHPVAKAVENGEFQFGIIFCASGNGVNMTANKYRGIRSALCWNTEIAFLARKHNNANICAIPAKFVSENEAEQITSTFINTSFEGGRHQIRIDKIPIIK